MTQVRDFSFTASRDPIGPFSSDSTIYSVVRQAYDSMLGDDDGSNRFTILCYVTNNRENFKTSITGASEKLHTAALCSSSVGH